MIITLHIVMYINKKCVSVILLIPVCVYDVIVHTHMLINKLQIDSHPDLGNNDYL